MTSHVLSPGRPRVAITTALAWLCACGAPGSGAESPNAKPPGAAAPARSQTAGLVTQGRTLQGRTLQGRTLQGTALAGVTVGGAAVAGLTLSGTSFSGTIDGRLISGRDFIGAVFQEVTPDGAIATVQIRDIAPDPQDPSGQRLLYALWSEDPQHQQSGPACQPDPSGDQRALPLRGTWDERGDFTDSAGTFSFACTAGVLAKCARWGYEPWATRDGVPLRDHHQACTRLARADYCGDGTPSTQDGTLIDIYDGLGIQQRDPSPLLLFDGAWTPQGAYCMSKERWLTLQNVLSLSCRLRFVNLGLLNLLEPSPVSSADVCVLKRTELSRDQVLIDNRAGINVGLGGITIGLGP